MTTKIRKPVAPPISASDAKKMIDLFDDAVSRFQGGADELESAIGMYVLGRHLGWKVLYIFHSKKTVAKYEGILGINVREHFPEEGPGIERSMGYKLASSFSNFWKVVSGEEKIDRVSRKELR